MHPSPLPHQTPSLSPPQPDCRGPNKSSRENTGRDANTKSEKAGQKPQQHNSKQVEHHLGHPGPRGAVNRDSAGFPLLMLSFDYSTSLTLCNEVWILSIPSVTNDTEHAASCRKERMVTITMATLLSAELMLIFRTSHGLLSCHCPAPPSCRIHILCKVCSPFLALCYVFENCLIVLITMESRGIWSALPEGRCLMVRNGMHFKPLQ